MIKVIHDLETNSILEIELSPEEIAQRQAQAEKDGLYETQTAAAKAALLEKLGITEEEAKLLLS